MRLSKCKYLFSTFVILCLTSSQCKKEDDDCHHEIRIKNNSTDPVYFAIEVKNAAGKCRLDGTLIAPQGLFDYRFCNWCVENCLGKDELVEIYFVDPHNVNLPGYYYPGDSIFFYNEVWDYRKLSETNLSALDFTVNYP